ncbi:MAG: hypothetical protein FD180_4175 [Planctomycetota bacterium]|nr:MAG: hypothetical protein FD180_4175 [Planctomycetota bacterium]
MKIRFAFAAACAAAALIVFAPDSRADGKKKWSVKADYIEGCSCHLMCSCYFNTGPEGGHMCEFNNAVKIAEGFVGDIKVDGCKFWLSGDLGGDFSKGEMKGCVVTFDTKVTKEQQEALVFLINKIYPVTWKKLQTDTADITWEKKDDGTSHAKCGDKGEITLTPFKQDGKQTVIENLKYWGAQKNTGFFLCKSSHWYKGHGYDYKHEDKNGFTIHLESEGEDEMKK